MLCFLTVVPLVWLGGGVTPPLWRLIVLQKGPGVRPLRRGVGGGGGGVGLGKGLMQKQGLRPGRRSLPGPEP